MMLPIVQVEQRWMGCKVDVGKNCCRNNGTYEGEEVEVALKWIKERSVWEGCVS